jgi:dihydrofolate reductase
MKIIACCDIEGGFAKDKKIPWIGEDFSKLDLKHFKQITDGSVLVMGRNTYLEIAGMREITTSLLPNRECYVVTSNPENLCPGATTISSIDEIKTDKEIFVIGGERLYRENIRKCDTVYLSLINKNYNCDQTFPGQSLIHYSATAEDSEHPDLIFITYTKKQ